MMGPNRIAADRSSRAGSTAGDRGGGRATAHSAGDIEFIVDADRVFRILLLVTGVLVVLSTASRMVVLYGPDFPARDSLANFLYVDVERSLPTLFSTAMMLTAALLCAAIAHARRRIAVSNVRHWIVLFTILGVLALDEFGQLHEKFMDPLRGLLDIEGGPLWFAWVIPAIVLLALFLLFFVRFLARLPRTTRRGMLIAGLLFVGGALGVEMVSASYAADHPVVDATYVVMVTVEETLEMLGMSVLISTLLVYIGIGLPDIRWTARIAAQASSDR